jgi:hypothetical protein
MSNGTIADASQTSSAVASLVEERADAGGTFCRGCRSIRRAPARDPTAAYDHVVRYRKKCEAAGAHPDDLRTLADLARFPFTTKQDLRDGYPFESFAVRRSEVIRVHASSGTTGKPTVVG